MGTLLREINTFHTIEILPRLTIMGFRSWTYTLCSIVEWARRTSNFNASMPIPPLTDLASRISTGVLSRQPHKSWSTFTLIIERIINLITFTNSYCLAGTSTIPSSIWANTCIGSFIPNFSIFARYLRWYTFSFIKYFSTNTDACFLMIVPYLSSLTRVLHAMLTVPHSCWWALTSPSVLVPHHASLTTLNHNTKLAIPLCSRSTNTLVLGLIPHFSVYALNTELSIPVKAFRTFTL